MLDWFTDGVANGTCTTRPQDSLTQRGTSRFYSLGARATQQTGSAQSCCVNGTAYQRLGNCRQQGTARRSQASLFCWNAPLFSFDLSLALDVAAGKERKLSSRSPADCAKRHTNRAEGCTKTRASQSPAERRAGLGQRPRY